MMKSLASLVQFHFAQPKILMRSIPFNSMFEEVFINCLLHIVPSAFFPFTCSTYMHKTSSGVIQFGLITLAAGPYLQYRGS